MNFLFCWIPPVSVLSSSGGTDLHCRPKNRGTAGVRETGMKTSLFYATWLNRCSMSALRKSAASFSLAK